MNAFHRRYCASDRWAARMADELLPWTLDGVDLGDDVLELGPGPGVTTRLLAGRVPRLTVLEVDPGYAAALAGQFADRDDVTVVHGDAARMPFPDRRFSAVVCFTMLHHVPSAALQDALFAQACRVLVPGGLFAGSDSQPSLRFRVIHLFDTMTVVHPTTLPDRLRAAGFAEVDVQRHRSLRWRARTPGAA